VYQPKLKGMEIVYIGLGANIPGPFGPPEESLARAVERIGSLGRVVSRSRLYSTAPVGYAEQPRFVNAAAALETELSARELMDALLRVEREFGRDRTGTGANAIPNGPRTLDLDILLYGQHVLREPGIEVPHPRLAERAFVLVPLSEIAPDAMVPGFNRSVKELLECLNANAAQETDEVIAFDSDFWPGA
jgi:2-amino-4-hydroxy-6-hydroxymethyldihydropteridine diphosphokinase